MSQTTYYKDQLAVQLDQKGFVTSVILNTFENVPIKETESIIHIFSPDDYEKFYSNFSQTMNEKISVGFRIKLVNTQQVFMFMLKNNETITLFSVSMEDEVITLFDELVKINNEQIQSIRSLYKKLSKYEEDDKFLEEIMLVNNSLINTRRELSNKNYQLEKLNKKLEYINDTDYLTQIPNRRKFFKDSYEKVLQEPYQLIMMDFNNFKVVNDQLGHKTGDELLVFFCQKVNKKLSNIPAQLYRLGGDEFAILKNRKSPLDIDQLMKSMDTAIKQFHADLSMAYGVVDISNETVNKDHPIEESMNKADRLMYTMKQQFHKEYDTKTK